MQAPERPLPQTRADRPAGDELDRLLRGYYCQEMPSPWPAAPVVSRTEPSRSLRWSGWAPVSSRLALAATLGLVALGTICLAGLTPKQANKPGTNENRGLSDPTANPEFNKIIIQDAKNRELDDAGREGFVEPPAHR